MAREFTVTRPESFLAQFCGFSPVLAKFFIHLFSPISIHICSRAQSRPIVCRPRDLSRYFRRLLAISSSETQGWTGRRVYGRTFTKRVLKLLADQFLNCLTRKSSQTEARISNSPGTGHVSVRTQGISRSSCKLARTDFIHTIS